MSRLLAWLVPFVVPMLFVIPLLGAGSRAGWSDWALFGVVVAWIVIGMTIREAMYDYARDEPRYRFGLGLRIYRNV